MITEIVLTFKKQRLVTVSMYFQVVFSHLRQIFEVNFIPLKSTFLITFIRNLDKNYLLSFNLIINDIVLALFLTKNNKNTENEEIVKMASLFV